MCSILVQPQDHPVSGHRVYNAPIDHQAVELDFYFQSLQHSVVCVRSIRRRSFYVKRMALCHGCFTFHGFRAAALLTHILAVSKSIDLIDHSETRGKGVRKA